MVAQSNAAGLGMVGVTGTLPVRQEQFPQGVGHIREFEGFAMAGFPVRVMEIVIVGEQAAVELTVMMNLFRWTEFAAPCLSLVMQLTLAGAAPAQGELQAVYDDQRQDQIEYQMVTPGSSRSPTSLPTNFQGTVIVNIDTLVEAGDINGTGIAIGSHTVAKVESEEGTNG